MAVLTSSGIQFSDSTTQTTAGIPLTGGTMTNTLVQTALKVYNSGQYTAASMRNVRVWAMTSSLGAGLPGNLITNTNAYDDVFFMLFTQSFHSSIGYKHTYGSFGGYGISTFSPNSSSGSISVVSAGAGYGTLRLDYTGYSGSGQYCMLIFGNNPITVNQGTLY
jgi:hypothetical protein